MIVSFFHLLFDLVVRTLFCDVNIVGMALFERGLGNFDELAVFGQIGDIVDPKVAHARAETAEELEDHIAGIAPIRNPAFDAFRNQFLVVSLEITIGTAVGLFHRSQRAHAAIDLVFSSHI